jgi:hypothetical protein
VQHRIPRVVLNYLAAEEISVEVGVDFCGGDFFVSQHCLDGAEVGSTFQQVGGEGVAEGVGAYRFVDAGCLYAVF